MTAHRTPPARAASALGRAVGRAGAALALAASLALAGAPGAVAVDEITTQDYVGPLGVANEAAAGYTGAGVTIAVIEGPADTTVPELAGADITVKPMCAYTATPDGRSHATGMVSILAARGYGVARGARITNYSIPSSDDTDKGDCSGMGIDDAISAAVADGARVISISRGGGRSLTASGRPSPGPSQGASWSWWPRATRAHRTPPTRSRL